MADEPQRHREHRGLGKENRTAASGKPAQRHLSLCSLCLCGAIPIPVTPMPSLNFKGRALVQNFHPLVPYHELKPVKSKSLTDKVSLFMGDPFPKNGRANGRAARPPVGRASSLTVRAASLPPVPMPVECGNADLNTGLGSPVNCQAGMPDPQEPVAGATHLVPAGSPHSSSSWRGE